MHFLKKLVQTPTLTDPANKFQSVHRHFYRYSKGDFDGPVIKFSKTKPKITIKASFEYEDLVQELVVSALSEKEVDVDGVLITGSDISKVLTNLGLDWRLKKSTGQAENYKTDIEEKMGKKMLLDVIEALRDSSYFLISFSEGVNCKITTKKRIPQPSNKKEDKEDEPDKKLQFCNGIIPNTATNEKSIIEAVAIDFKSDIAEGWKNITITNKYKILDIDIPKDVKDSRLLRVMAVRKGVLFRTLTIDDETIEKQYKIIV